MRYFLAYHAQRDARRELTGVGLPEGRVRLSTPIVCPVWESGVVVDELYLARPAGRSVLERFGVPERWSRLTIVVGVVAAMTLIVEGVPAAATPAQVPLARSVAQPLAPDLSGPAVAADAITASVQARAQGRPVEDLSQRTVESSTFAMPDGTWATGVGSGPVWVPQMEETGGDGTALEDWAPVDLTLELGQDGLVRPVAQVADLVLSGGTVSPVGGHDSHTAVAAVTDPNTGVMTTSGWDGPLPAPRLEGRRAVYEGVRPGADLVVEATSTGFEEFFVLEDATAAQSLAEADLSLAAGGAHIEELPGETLAVTDSSGEVAASSGTPLMWDSAADGARLFPLTAERPAEPTGGRALSPMPDFGSDRATVAGSDVAGEEPAQRAGVDPALVADPMAEAVVVERVVKVTGEVAEVSLAPDEEFLTDPDTQFPVVIDPSVSVRVGFDTYVKKGSTTDWSAATELLVGTWDSGANVARSFLQFNTTAIAGKAVTAARLEMYAFHSYSCQPRNWQVWHTFSVSSATRWTSQPSWQTLQATSSSTSGYGSGCPDSWAHVDVRNIVAAGAAKSDAQLTLGVRAENEADSYGWKRFYAADNGANIPSLWVTYNSYPSTPSTAAHVSGQYYRGADPVTGASTLYATTARPGFSAIVSDPDGGTVRGAFDVLQGSTTVWNKVKGAAVASGSRSTFTPTTSTPALADGKTYTARVWGYDGSLTSKSSTGAWAFTTDLTDPTKPAVSSTSYATGQWRDAAPSSNRFTFTSTSSDVMKFEYQQDGAATWSSVPATTSGATRAGTLSWNPGSGSHSLSVRAVDKANRASPATKFTFGSGGAALSSPSGGAKSTDTFTVSAAAPSATTGTVTPSIYWRAAGTADATGWNTTSGSTAGWTLDTTLPAVAAGKAVSVSTAFSAAAAATAMGQSRTPALIDVQVCFTYSATGATRCTWVGEDPAHPSHTSVLRVPHAFGDAFPEADAGPGKVALWTGEFSTSSTDISVPTPKDTLSISRTYASFAGPASSAASAVFGPGWAANLDGSDFGAAGYEVVDSTGIDGTIALVDGDGQALVYRQPGATKVAGKPGVYVAVDEETAAEGARMELTTAAGTALSLTEDDGTVTRWTPGPTGTTGSPTWVVQLITQAGDVGSTTFTRDAKGRITRILAPAPDGVTCPTTGPLVPGCRALRLVYATSTTATAATPGDYTDRLVEVYYDAYNPERAGGAGMDAVEVATYTYTAEGYLATATDPRSDLTTAYSYNGLPTGLNAPQLEQVTPPGLATWHLDYAPTPQGTHGLTTVSRDPASRTATPVAQAAFVYAIPLVGTGLPTVDVDTVGTWGQPAAPTWGAAVFDADHAATVSGPTARDVTDWRQAELQYTDAQGRVINTASYGAGDWQLSATDYDTEGRVVRTLDAGAIAQIRDVLAEGGSADADTYATITRYNAAITASASITHAGGTIAAGTVLTPAGTLVTDVWEPATPAGPNGELVRVRTHTDYDQGAPNSGVSPTTGIAYRLPTTVTTTVAAPDSASSDPAQALPTGEEVTAQVKTGYDPIDGTSVTGPTSGWTLGVATTTTTVMGQGQEDITARTAYNSAGQTVQTRQPESTGTDAGTTNQIYYTAGANPADAACGNRPEYAGLPCATRTGETTPTIATTRTTDYTLYLAPRTVTEALGAVVRTTTTTYTADGRTSTAATATSGLPDSTPVAVSETEYSPTTGLPTATVALENGAETGRITTGYDAWGRVTSYTDADGHATTTTYTTTGDVQTINDTTGTLAYTYDGLDADGLTEFRGLATAMSITNADQPALELGAAYDAGGNLIRQALPGGIEQNYTYDRAGQLTKLTYTGEGVDGRFEWFAFGLTRDADGDIVGDTAPGRARTFTIDRADRLSHVTDIIDTVDDASRCTSRRYAFDANGNRTTATDDPCTAPGGISRSWEYDAADRVLSGANGEGGYIYDSLGRQTSIPGADSPAGPSDDDLQIGYYDTDLVSSTTQNGTTTAYGLDPATRRSVTTTQSQASTATTVRHYGDTSDNPTWVTANQDASTTTTRYIAGLADGLALEITNNRPIIAVSDPHGTIATEIAIPANISAYASVPAGWLRTDEYGNRLHGANSDATGALTYRWHGRDERASDVSGLTLMGARLYNPVTGLFTSRDPVPGGNTTTYTYPQDPVNVSDLTGLAWFIPILGRAAWSACRKYCASAGRAVYNAVRPRAANVTRHVQRSFKQNNVLRVGRTTTGQPFRVSAGATRKHWNKMGPVRRNVQRGHVHVERRGAAISWHGKYRTYTHRTRGMR